MIYWPNLNLRNPRPRMVYATSPLRYPGGKSCLLDLTATILRMNRLERGHYAEPFAGGCGLALSLLYGGHVADIHINDIDPSIWAFWHCVLNTTNELIEKIKSTPVTVEEWRKQRNIHQNALSHSILDRGFSAFFLNRTNRSGIISGAGVIGGLSQNGTYKIDCRYNKDNLTKRILRISKYKDRIHLTNMDAQDFLKVSSKSLNGNILFCIDPPYFKKGADLYTSFYNYADHCGLSGDVLALEKPWIVTYDNASEIQELYSARRQYLFDINYSVQTKRIGTELLIASKGLRLPEELTLRLINRPRNQAA
ncbi:DNA adenine methylase [Nitrospirillum amazonense]|uniref:DNA adenine methylase n=1 Tax=Nitrospirillum amazonense TaxID=28077 RepID=UPI002DD42BE8|nr:DNA adenine methylase [Nitrospirillum amazonense]MEC4591909.1 DNA adenine methylase [Nitrospirillum amazonense]